MLVEKRCAIRFLFMEEGLTSTFKYSLKVR
ncbi:hypothetical protein U724_06285 [Pseudomonas chlororaphis subsp. aurantiaca PB-St2]|nr:hypothetical protein U724_06285 [Pseudomonas chlororaphis subsp. aurantiaca PB-St2]